MLDGARPSAVATRPGGSPSATSSTAWYRRQLRKRGSPAFAASPPRVPLPSARSPWRVLPARPRMVPFPRSIDDLLRGCYGLPHVRARMGRAVLRASRAKATEHTLSEHGCRPWVALLADG